MERLFVYGTLRKLPVRKKVFGRSVKGFPDMLKGYKRIKIKIDGETFPVIVKRKGYSVKGLTIIISSKELSKADKYETRTYKRKRAVLKSGKSAWVYTK